MYSLSKLVYGTMILFMKNFLNIQERAKTNTEILNSIVSSYRAILKIDLSHTDHITLSYRLYASIAFEVCHKIASVLAKAPGMSLCHFFFPIAQHLVTDLKTKIGNTSR